MARLGLLLTIAVAAVCCDESTGSSQLQTGTGATTGSSGTAGGGGSGTGGMSWSGGGSSTTGSSSGTGAAGGSSSGAGGSGGSCDGFPSTVPVDCVTYCSLMDGSCTNSAGHFNDQYPGGYPDVCSSVCPFFELGALDDTTGNTLTCRLHHACLAQHDPDTYCVAAGPGGGAGCGDLCESFCALNLAICTGPHQQWASLAACQQSCAGLDFTEPYSASSDNLTGTTNAYACRLYWLMLAVDDPAGSCANTNPGSPGIDPCVDGI